MFPEKLQILTEIFGYYYSSNDEHLFHCLFCNHHKNKLSINVSKNTYKCWICDVKGRNLWYLVKRFGTQQQKQYWRQITNKVDITEFDKIFQTVHEPETKQKIKLPEEFVSLAKKDVSVLEYPAMKYLKKRGIIREDIVKWKIGYCSEGEYKNRIIVPSFRSDGYCNYFIA